MCPRPFAEAGRLAPRLRALFDTAGHGLAQGLHEASLTSTAAPGAHDATAISQRLQTVAGPALSAQQTDAIAARLVTQAREGLQQLADGAPGWRLSDEQISSFEAVLQIRGRPALRVVQGDLEPLAQHPGAKFWAVHIDLHRKQLGQAIRAVGAVRVNDAYGNAWGQGTAFLVASDLMLTNRHVLAAPGGGQSLVQYLPGNTAAQVKADFTLTIDFAFEAQDNGLQRYQVLDVPFITPYNDPVDAALLRIQPVPASHAQPLAISRLSAEPLDHLYVIGHPGRLVEGAPAVLTVFGSLDDRKRVSFGRKYPSDAFDPPEIVHDASTIGGYSGGPVLGFDEFKVKALHYWGDPRVGNRAISATALQRHAQLGPLLRQGGNA